MKPSGDVRAGAKSSSKMSPFTKIVVRSTVVPFPGSIPNLTGMLGTALLRVSRRKSVRMRSAVNVLAQGTNQPSLPAPDLILPWVRFPRYRQPAHLILEAKGHSARQKARLVLD